MVKLHKPQRMGNRKSVIAYHDVPEIEVDDDADDASDSDSLSSGRDTLFVSKNNGCIPCHRDAHQRFKKGVSVSIGPHVGVGASTSTDLSSQMGRRTTSTIGVSALLGISVSVTQDRRAGTPAMPTIVVAEPDNTRVGGN